MSTPLLSQNARAVLATYEAVNRRDLEGSIAPVADHYRFVDHAQRVSGEGKESIRTWMASMLAASSDMSCEPEVLVDLGDVVIVKVVCRGTHDGPFGGVAASGRPVRTTQCEVHRFDDTGLLVESELFYDLYGMLADMGVLPPASADREPVTPSSVTSPAPGR